MSDFSQSQADQNTKLRTSFLSNKKSLSVQNEQDSTTYGPTVQLEDYIESIFAVSFGLLTLAMLILCVLHLLNNKNNYAYYTFCILLCLYQMLNIVLCTYYCCRFQFVDIKNSIRFSKFWIQSLFSSLFNLVAGILLIVHLLKTDHSKWYFANATVYLLGTVSIPFPAICIKLHHQYKYYDLRRPKNHKISSSISRNAESYSNYMSTSVSKSAAASVAAGKPIFGNNILKGALCACYIAHFLSFVVNPLNKQKFSDLMRIMYGSEHDIANQILYSINQVFLRMFVGMCLISVFFTFVTELTDKKVISTNYCLLFYLWIDHTHLIWVIVWLLLCFSIPYEIFSFRKLNVFNSTSGEFIINIIWTALNVFGALHTMQFIIIFQGIYRKTKREFGKFYSSSPTSPIKAFVLEAIFLLCLYAIYIAFMFVHIAYHDHKNNTLLFINHIKWDIFRQAAILVLLCLQFVTLIRMKQIQKFGRNYLKHFSKRSNLLLNAYYKWTCLLLIYNIYYVFAFCIQYFNSFKDTNNYKMVGYTFSFSLCGLMLVMLSDLLYSYGQWKYDEREDEQWKQKHSEANVEDESIPRNSNAQLNEHLNNTMNSANRKKNSCTASSLVPLYEE